MVSVWDVVNELLLLLEILPNNIYVNFVSRVFKNELKPDAKV